MWCWYVPLCLSRCRTSIERSDTLVGFSISPEELYAQAASYIAANAISGWSNLSSVIGGLKNTPGLRWASPLDLKNTVEKVFVDTFGSKEEALAKLKAEKAKVGKQQFYSQLHVNLSPGCEEAYPEGT